MGKQFYSKIFALLLIGWLSIFTQSVSAQCTAPTATKVNNNSCVTGTGTITFTGPGTTATHLYSIDNGVTFFPTMTFDSLYGGTYTLVVKVIATSCISPATTVTLTNPANPAAPVISASTNITNCNVPNGSITFSTVANIQYSTDNGNSFYAPGTTVINNLDADTYPTVALNTTTGCVSGITNRTLTEPTITGPVATLTQPTLCTLPSNGQINFTAIAGAAFSIDGGITFGAVGQTAFTGLAPATWPTLYKNANGCLSAVINRTLNSPAAPASPTSTVTNVTNCNTPNGSITFTAPAPGTNRFSIDGGATFGTAGVAVFNNLSAKTYATLVMNPTTGCISDSIAEKVIALPTLAAPAATLTNPTSCSTPNGSISFTAIGGAVFSIDGGATYGAAAQTVFNGLTGKAYVTMYKNANGCLSAKVTRTLTNPTVPVPVSTLTNPTSCSAPNGKITFTAVAGTVFKVNSSSPWGTTGQLVFSNLAAGTYATQAQLSSSGCVSAAVTKTLVNPAVTAATVTVTQPTSCIPPNGKIVVTAPTSASYVFSKDGGATFAAAGVTTFSNLGAGTYRMVTKLKTSGCISAPVTSTITLPTLTIPTATVTNSGCLSNTGAIQFTGPAPLTTNKFSITGGTTYAAAGTVSFTGLAPATYLTKVQNAAGCVSAGTTPIAVGNTVTTAPTTTLTASSQCNPYNASIAFTAPTPLSSYTFSIDSGATFHPAGDPSFSTLPIATYYTRARNNATGCVSAAVAKTTTASNPILTLTPTFTQTNVTSCSTPNGKITITGLSNGNTASGLQFSIDGGTTWSSSATTTTYTFANLPNGRYYVMARNPSNACPSLAVSTAITKPAQAGTDITICLNQNVTMSATALSGASWTAAAGNPTPAPTITTPASAVTAMTGFKTVGTYNFIWGNASCTDTVQVIVNDCASSWGCPSNGFLFKTDNATFSDVLAVDLGTGTQTTIISNYADPASKNVINAVGFNVTDGEIWGSYLDSARVKTLIVQVGADRITHLYEVKGITPGGYNVGTVDNNGVLYLYTSNTTQIFRVDVNPTSPTYLTLLAPVLTTPAMNIADFAFNPIDGFLYGVDGTGTTPNFVHHLLKINPNTGNATTVGLVTATPAGTWGAAAFGANYFDALGNLYVADNTAGGVYKINRVQNVTGNTTAALRSQGQPSAGNDGALCHNACIKPDAGRDTAACLNFGTQMTANGVSGIQWLPVPGNPGTITIADDADANTHMDFSAPGTYAIIWTDGGTCNDTVTVNVSLQPVTPAGVATVPTCADQSANITLSTPLGSSLMYTMDDNGLPQSSPVFTNVPAGGHTFLAVDTITSCTSNPPAQITVLAAPSVPDAPVTATSGAISCASPTTSITVNTPSSGVVYSFDGGLTYQASNVKSNLGNGAYNVIAKDNTSGCPSDPTIVNIDPPALATDFGDLTTGTWPVISSSVPSCQFTSNAPSPYNAVSNPFAIVWAGARINTEPATVNGGNATANSDSYDDGLGFPTGGIFGGITSQYVVTANANTPTTAYYRLWFDWNDDGDFSNDVDDLGSPASYAGTIATSGPTPASVDVIPPTGFSPTYKVRMVVTDASNTQNNLVPDYYRNGAGGAATPTAVATLTNGEVEDYNAQTIPLPLDLLTFTARKTDNSTAMISWTTANEQNVHQFIVERSQDDQQWTAIGMVKAAGNHAASQRNSYRLPDAQPLNGNNYYRLRIMDQNGDYRLSEIQKLVFNGMGNTILLAPNPSQGHTTVRCTQPLTGDATLKVWNSVGQILLEVKLPSGTTAYDLNLGNEPKGIYHVSIIGAGINQQTRLILK